MLPPMVELPLASSPTQPDPAGDHHGDHRGLLVRRPVDLPPAEVDAIVVPSYRTSVYLDHVIELAERLGCLLLVLCSGRSRAADVLRRRAGRTRHVLAIDVAELQQSLWSALHTDLLPEDRALRRTGDTSFKRNLGLTIAKAAGWERIAFLDDDIFIRRPDDLREAAGMLDGFGEYDHLDAVGLENSGFQDNSVVCHAYRIGNGRQTSFIGGGALVLAPQRSRSFFPNVYNEDWFYLLDGSGLGTIGIHGTADQKEFDPFASVDRARAEEFGDCLAEGVYWLLDNRMTIADADKKYWAGALERRRLFIAHVEKRIRRTDLTGDDKARILAALAAAERRRQRIKPEDCDDFLTAWLQDREQWSARFAELEPESSLLAALKRLGLNDHAIRHKGAEPRSYLRSERSDTELQAPVTSPVRPPMYPAPKVGRVHETPAVLASSGS
ncbi:hypothetical protein Val02_76020 [Virgisporangium aliadipatigenens]|uniref:Glycosyltransferase n=1 Tax=Virgisporangium aliadipatigenens TaxID=741659 RepID=A0A8J3YSJ9_9ACTN|nr:hypothetical protein [Virgisporangium aliadipatigenens]GIJ50716.1 hypothetical protein Val02_76020 [Virgisporangium aliadipatigenens]